MITQSIKTVNGIDLRTPPLIDPPPRTTTGEPPSKLLVLCVWWGKLYPKKYVEILRNSVKRNLTIPYEFYCLTDHDIEIDGVNMLPILKDNKTTWWNKISLFKPDLFNYNRRILYLDLDVVITGSLDRIASVKEDFCMIENYGPNKRHAAHNSSVMVWTPCAKTDQIYTKFSADVMKELHGDQCWIFRMMHPNIWDFPKDWIVSYKYSKLPQWNHISKDTSVYVFHGEPKPAKVQDKIIKDNWK